MSRPTHGNLVWVQHDGLEKVVIENKTWQILQQEKKRLISSFPKYYGNKKLGILKPKYRKNDYRI